ncbi:DNA polymerase kappa, putative [Phytophthora infestans T30-4]|uniref:DNA polymerase kappa n=1 Tax=Phytophthora infestans (strain T30-4) TaxID=403677 RepID=D0MYB5_PHYIT|nr:DNA polymerase kappa, putative [Phytophthora infestans T30-4]EEY66163.1 DNA polymerase kappa, putative [Phytophthora infestans T30-4]|eukprot:XP_002906762.1 DNA polymerase kappa, putative [Phytophthora infestans T30-4]
MFVFTADKAGMKGVDKQHVQEVVHKMSKDSSFFQKSLRDNAKVEQRVAAMREKLACLTGSQIQRLQQEADARVAQLEATRDLSRTIVVVDMDMFYAAVEMRDDPKLRDVPLAVGGLGMISTTNYAARQFGVRAAMPGFIGKELCPDLHFVPVNMKKYAGVAAEIRAVFAEYDPDFEAFSLDEACLDLTDYIAENWQKYISDAMDEIESKESDKEEWASTASGRAAIAAVVVRELRKKVFDCTQLTASAGIAVNSMLAKICSDMNKPNGQYVLPFSRERVMTFIRELPVRKIGGIGKVMEKTLNEALDVQTGGDLFDQRGKIAHLFSGKTAMWLLQTSLGVQERREKQERKSFSRERTFKRLSDPKQLEEKSGSPPCLLPDPRRVDPRLHAQRSLGVAAIGADVCSDVNVVIDPVVVKETRRVGFVCVCTMYIRNCSTHNFVGTRGPGPSKRGTELDYQRVLLVDDAFPEVDNKPCPICGKLLNTQNNFEVNAHIDACTNRKQSSSLSSSPLRHATYKKQQKRSISQAFTTVQKFMKSSEEDSKPCPICGKLLNARSNMEVNAHMDACVTRDPSPQKRTIGKKRDAQDMSKIDVFFRKDNNN